MCDGGNCGKTFDSNTDLKRHQNLHDNNLQKCYFCPWRSPAFKNDAILSHFDQHLDHPRFSCPVCGKTSFSLNMICKNILRIRMKKLKENTSVDHATLEAIQEFMLVII